MSSTTTTTTTTTTKNADGIIDEPNALVRIGARSFAAVYVWRGHAYCDVVDGPSCGIKLLSTDTTARCWAGSSRVRILSAVIASGSETVVVAGVGRTPGTGEPARVCPCWTWEYGGGKGSGIINADGEDPGSSGGKKSVE